MKTNIRKSLDTAISLHKVAILANNRLHKFLDENQDIDDDLQILMCELQNNMVLLHEAAHTAIEAYAEQLQIFGSEGREKQVYYQVKGEEDEPDN